MPQTYVKYDSTHHQINVYVLLRQQDMKQNMYICAKASYPERMRAHFWTRDSHTTNPQLVCHDLHLQVQQGTPIQTKISISTSLLESIELYVALALVADLNSQISTGARLLLLLLIHHGCYRHHSTMHLPTHLCVGVITPTNVSIYRTSVIVVRHNLTSQLKRRNVGLRV